MIKLANIKPLGMVYSPVDQVWCLLEWYFQVELRLCFFISIFKVLDIGLLPLHDLLQVVIYGLAKEIWQTCLGDQNVTAKFCEIHKILQNE